MSTAIHWFRRDLRLSDNTALNRAAAEHDQVVPVYITSEWRERHHWCGYPRQAFLAGCLRDLDTSLRVKGGRLIVRSGDPVVALEKLAAETGADTICYNRDPDPHGRNVEKRVAQVAAKRRIRIIACKDHALHERDEVLTAERKPYRVFTPYARAWSRLEKAAPGRGISEIRVPKSARSDKLPDAGHWGLQGNSAILQPGESAARMRLGAFLDGPILRYSKGRDRLAEQGTSRLSQDLRHGTLSIREIYASCQAAARATRSTEEKQNVSAFINELIWREFYFQVLWHWPDVLEHEFLAEYRGLPWRARWRPEDDATWDADPAARSDFDRWRSGQTGFPVVDAAMRELQATGFMHNRARMITAMFLTKDLRIWWMHGEAWFMQQLVDGEIASNNGGWQWSASTGTDAAPYFRIQNPWAQTQRFDPEGEYIRRWVPELRDVPARRFFAPPPQGERSLAPGYPLPMVDHAAAREQTLKLFRESRLAQGK
jgi:deoxyribodipyrimidine photo-lyase